MARETDQGHFEYPAPHEQRWYKNGELIDIDGNVAEQTHDGIVDWLEQLELRLTGVVEQFGDLPDPNPDKQDPRTGNERIYLVRNRETFYRDTGTEWVVTGGNQGDAVGAGHGITLTEADGYVLDRDAATTWHGIQEFANTEVGIRLGDQASDPIQDGDFVRNGNHVKVRTGGVVKNLTNIGTGDGGGSTTSGTDVISAPNLNVPFTELADTERIGNPVSVANNQTLTVKAWGVSDSDGTTPSGLRVELLDHQGSIVTDASTPWAADSTGVASWTNTTGSRQMAQLAVSNGTGTSYTDPDGVGGQFGYVISD